ncbi:ScbR family autoregulator-binding transcription factor [Streptomyces sp. NPDC019890]|uniref:ScbR family autoregulator-binding transcription factor n=1 Tax=Streptomyces sp. NPDC019890 TaxID=3365064 RepID=UPI00384FCBE0
MSTKQERAVRTRCALIHAAALVFDQAGYAQAKLDSISRSAGVSRGALFFHFANKEAVASAVEDEASAVLRTVTANVYRTRESAMQALIDSTHLLARLLNADVLVRGGYRLNRDNSRPSSRNLHLEWQAFVGRLLDEAAAEQTLLPTAPRGDIRDAVVAAMTGFQVLGGDDPAWLSSRAVTRFWCLLLPRLVSADLLPGLAPEGVRVPGAGAADAASVPDIAGRCQGRRSTASGHGPAAARLRES